METTRRRITYFVEKKLSLVKMASTGTALFGSNIGTSSKNLVEFRAGKMKLNGTTVTADKRKGLVYVFQGDDSLMHFCWKDRTTGTVEDVRCPNLNITIFMSFVTLWSWLCSVGLWFQLLL